ncbi:MAG: hypothetical protein LHV68_06030 [Elusimicrobia bacterium]|nr:hypothetical protein [Candidatus Liberimonas magnetica]
MPGIRVNTSQEVKTRVVSTIMGRIQLTDFLTLPENEFRRLVNEVENDPVFKKLAYPDKSEEKIISYKRYLKTGAASKYYELSSETSQDVASPDVESVIDKNKGIVKIVRKIGLEKFKNNFIYNENDLGVDDISKECGISADEARQIMALVNEISVIGEFHLTPKTDPEQTLRYWKVADVEREKSGFIIKSTNLSFARGKYSINYKKLLELREKGILDEKEINRVNRLISKLELINTRKNIVYKVIQLLLKEQKDFFVSGNEKALRSFNQREAARELQMTPGVLSRAISAKSISLPCGKEVPLKEFFPSKKDKNKEIVKSIIAESDGRAVQYKYISDNVIKEILNQRYGINLSRRSICQYRSEM